PAAVSYPTLEWQLPWMDADPTSSNPSGSFSVNAESLPAELNNPPDLPRIASCTWHFTKSGATSTQTTPNPTNNATNNSSGNSSNSSGSSQTQNATTTNNSGCLRSSGDIVQSFASMKADVERQFDRLIQEAADASTKQSLQQQKQQTLAGLAEQE